MGYGVPSHLCFCVASNRVIFLDQRRDRYFCLSQTSERAFFALLTGGTLSLEDRAELETLCSAEILRRGEGDAIPTPCTFAMPEADLSGHAARTTPRDGASALLALVRVVRQLRAGQLAQLAGALRSRKRAQTAGCIVIDARLLRALAAFDAAERILGRHDQCLRRSLALQGTLLHLGYASDLVFAVTARPFMAHCWVQLGGTVLNDRLENVRAFTPVMVL